MSKAARDENRVPTLIGVSSIDESTPTRVGVDPTTNEVLVTVGYSLPTSGSNSSLVLAYTGSNLTSITKTINGTDYVKTLGYDGSNNLTSVSAWVEQ